MEMLNFMISGSRLRVKEEKEGSSMAPGSPPTPPHTPQSPSRQSSNAANLSSSQSSNAGSPSVAQAVIGNIAPQQPQPGLAGGTGAPTAEQNQALIQFLQQNPNLLAQNPALAHMLLQQNLRGRRSTSLMFGDDLDEVTNQEIFSCIVFTACLQIILLFIVVTFFIIWIFKS